MTDVKFVDGLIVKAPHANAPEFVKCAISIKRKDLGNWLRSQTDEWINVDVKVSKQGKWYALVNDFKPEPQSQPASEQHPDFDDESIPF